MTSQIERLCDDYPYWVETMLDILDEKGSAISFVMNSVQRMVDRIEQQALAVGIHRFLILKARRTGVTTHQQAKALHEMWRKPNTRCLTLAHTDDAISEIFQDMVIYMYNSMPEGLQPDRGRESGHRLVFERLKSRIRCLSAAGKAPGRGGTYSRVHVSEAAYIAPSKIKLFRAGVNEAVREGVYVEESTANGCIGGFYEACIDALNRGDRSGWRLIFLPWFIDARNQLPLATTEIVKPGALRPEDEAFQIEGEHELLAMARVRHAMDITPAQLKWRRMKKNELPLLFNQEYPETPEEAFLASGASRFKAKAVSRGLKLAPPPMFEVPIKEHSLSDGKFKLRVPGPPILYWRRPHRSTEYVIGVDTSEGVMGGDPSYITVHNRITFEQVACWHGYLEPNELAKVCCILGQEYRYLHEGQFINALVAVERNNHGHSVLNSMCNHFAYDAIYCAADGRLGWHTTPITRPIMVDDLATAVDGGELAGKMNDVGFWRECSTFERLPTGKYAAVDPNKDDRILATAIALQVRTQRAGMGEVVEEPDNNTPGGFDL